MLQQAGFTTRPVQHRDLDWQTIVVVIRDLDEIAGSVAAIMTLAEKINAYRQSRRDQGKTPQGTLRRAGQPPLNLAHATDQEVLEWLLKTPPQA
ncbi:hypothetical protein [Chloroflexus sp.]|uniref:hypothetical protein n=1 Tax=Chloroflexus sp. TaxID=1904827 RepID=UPI002ADE1C81|nr:hypothetical protein [Chloroflexus sp.]